MQIYPKMVTVIMAIFFYFHSVINIKKRCSEIAYYLRVCVCVQLLSRACMINPSFVVLTTFLLSLLFCLFSFHVSLLET